ncbi:MAG: sulfotransferase [Caulobacterales bacterium]
MAKKGTGANAKKAGSAARAEEIAAAAASDLPRATEMAQAAKSEGVAHPLVHHIIAIKLREEGRFEDAIIELGLGLALDPNDARLMTEVGLCLLDLGRRREAARVLGVAIKLAPQSPDTNFAYGWAADRLGALDVAQAGFDRAVALSPNHVDALVGLSGLAVRRRDWDEAGSYAERALAIDPDQPDALTNLARIELGRGEFAAAEARLRRLKELPQLKAQARADIHLMLGDALDGERRYSDAFRAYVEGKSALRELFAHLYGSPGTRATSDGAREILAEFLETPVDAWKKPGRTATESGERGHAFLVGFPRSGTTLLEQVLGAHPDVVSLEERPLLIDAEEEFLTQPGGVRRLAGAVPALLAPYRQAYWKRVREFGVEPSGKVFIDKHPFGTFRLPLISKVFPDAKIIFAVRDPRDVVLSCFRRGFNMNIAMYEFNSIMSAANFYDAVMTAGDVYLEKLPVEAFQLRYEDLVSDFEATASGLCDFLGIAWTERMRDFAATPSARRSATPSSAQVTRGLYSEGVDQWRNYAFALEPVLPLLQPWIKKFGYDPA